MEASVAMELALMLRAGLVGGLSETVEGAAKIEAGEAGTTGVVVWCFWRKAGGWVLMGVGAGVDWWEEEDAAASFSSWTWADSGFLMVGTGPV